MSSKSTLRILILFIATNVGTYWLYSQSRIDTLYSEAALDGEISFFQKFSSLFVNATEGIFVPGDGTSAVGLGDNYGRGYLSFNLSSLPYNLSIESAELSVFQMASEGDGHAGWFPKWQVSGGDTMFCIVDHIVYGDLLDSLDWTAGDLGDKQTIMTNIGILSRDSSNGYKILDVTDAIKEDLKAGRKRSQFRVRFPVLTDNDGLNDGLQFANGEYKTWGYPQVAPRLVIRSTVTSVSKSDRASNTFIVSQNYPNPFNPSTVVLYALPRREKVDINVFDALGQHVQTLVSGTKEGGEYSIEFNAQHLSSGLYFVVVATGNYHKTVKAMLIK